MIIYEFATVKEQHQHLVFIVRHLFPRATPNIEESLKKSERETTEKESC